MDISAQLFTCEKAPISTIKGGKLIVCHIKVNKHLSEEYLLNVPVISARPVCPHTCSNVVTPSSKQRKN